MTFEQRKTPGDQTRGIPNSHHSHDESTTSSIADRADQSEVFAQQLQGIYVVIAQVKSPGPEPRYRRRFYAGLAAAQRHVDRARMNGREAHLFIGQLHVVDGDAR